MCFLRVTELASSGVKTGVLDPGFKLCTFQTNCNPSEDLISCLTNAKDISAYVDSTVLSRGS